MYAIITKYFIKFVYNYARKCIFMSNTLTQQNNLDPVFLNMGFECLTYDYIEELREENLEHNIIAQRGSQELFLQCDADICIFGGRRGGSKTFSLLLDNLKDIDHPRFYAAILREEKNDSSKGGGIVDKSDGVYSPFGYYNKSSQDMSWYFNDGGKLKFDYYSDSYTEFKKRFQGLELSSIGVDEITHMEYNYFKYLLTSNRNAHGIKNRFRGTCNPDPESWVVDFIDWWIDDDGYPIPERNGVYRYCFMYGETVNDIYWGDSKEEVYEKAKTRIDKLWRKEYEVLGSKEDLFIKSVTFIEGKLEENLKLIKSDPNYLANLANQSEEQVARDLDGNWKFKTSGVEMITSEMMEDFFANSHNVGNERRITCDVAFDGGDKCVMWYWEGNHIKDIHVSAVDSKKTVEKAKSFMQLHGVREENFCYDLNGAGQIFKGYFPRARGFNNQEIPSDGTKTMFNDLKAECAYRFVENLKEGVYSIDEDLLRRMFSGRNYKRLTLREILLSERKVIAQDEKNDKNWSLIKKAEMKKLIGRSPDFIESLIQIEYFNLKNTKPKRKGAYFL